MKLTRGKKTAMTGFAVFLAFMGVCTVVSKGVYASGLPQVVTVKPYSGSFIHEAAARGTVMQGQEYGVYVEAGLRVDTVSVDRGDVFREGDALFRIETGDLADVIALRRLEAAKLEAQLSEAIEADRRGRESAERAEERAGEDYDQAAVLADAGILECRQALEDAWRALAFYDQYLKELEQAENGGGDTGVPDGGENKGGGADSGEDSGLQDISREVRDPAQWYGRQEKRLQLERNVTAAQQALEDARTAVQTSGSDVNTLALETAYREESLGRLEALLDADGWVYAQVSGLVTDSRLKVGERTQDGASLVYALDDGKRVISAAFTEEEGRHLSPDTRLVVTARMADGSLAEGTALAEYLEAGEDGMIHGRFSYDLPGLSIGQTVELSLKTQTENFGTCIARSCVHESDAGSRYYVYVAEEQEGILGTEWKVREVEVWILDQSDTAAAIRDGEITRDTRVVSGADRPLTDGETVRVVR